MLYTVDTKNDNAGTFKIEREDHTLANLLRMQLLRDPNVIFVGYRHPHPIEHHILLRVQTVHSVNKGVEPVKQYLPPDALRNALTDLMSEVNSLRQQVAQQVRGG